MPKVFADLAISLDGFAAGPNQSLELPMGEGIDGKLHRWMFEEPEQNAAQLQAMSAHSAYVMGRNMFGPIRGTWDSADGQAWRGWWGEEPPYHAPVFVLTHFPRPPLELTGSTFSFVTDGIESALAQAKEAAGEGSVGIAGGAHTVRQYLAAGVVDELRLHVVPEVIGAGERVLDGLAGLELEPIDVVGNHLVTHLSYRVRN